jgi:hypothetical protein
VRDERVETACVRARARGVLLRVGKCFGAPPLHISLPFPVDTPSRQMSAIGMLNALRGVQDEHSRLAKALEVRRPRAHTLPASLPSRPLMS